VLEHRALHASKPFEQQRTFGDDQTAGLGQVDPAAAAFEQIRSHLQLELLDAPTERRLGDAESRGRIADCAEFGHGQERLGEQEIHDGAFYAPCAWVLCIESVFCIVHPEL